MVRAMPPVLKYYPQAKFVIVGDGHMRNEVVGLAHGHIVDAEGRSDMDDAGPLIGDHEIAGDDQ